MKALTFVCLMALAFPAWSQKPQIVSSYESYRSCCGPLPLALAPHSGVDFSGKFGDDVIAPADGDVVGHIGAKPETCGNTVAIYHRAFSLYTIYCHFQEVKVRLGQQVKRGDVIGTLGDSGNAGDCRPIRACAIVYMEVTTVPHGHPRAKPGETFNALDYSVGYFDPAKTYPTDRLALTYPVRCRD